MRRSAHSPLDLVRRRDVARLGFYDGRFVRYPVDEFTPQERDLLSPHFTNLDRPVFALVNTMRLATDTVSAPERFSCPQPPEQRVLAVSEAR